MFLLKFEEDYADEFNVYGMKLVTEEEIDEMTQAVLGWTKDVQFHFGSNEELELSADSVLQMVASAVELSEPELEMYVKLIGDDYGHFPELWEL